MESIRDPHFWQGPDKTLQDDVWIFSEDPHFDDRGMFCVKWKADDAAYMCGDEPTLFASLGWVKQTNVSVSKKGVFRGMHMQKKPYTQGKYVTCLNGAVIDAIVDMRPNSRSFRCMKTYMLDSRKPTSLWVPKGFLHGFLSLTDDSVFSYMCDDVYCRDAECGASLKSVLSDPMVDRSMCDAVHLYALDTAATLSQKDQKLPPLDEFEYRTFGIDR